MSPEPHDSSSPAVSVLGLHQSVLRATNSAFGVLGWLASRTHSVIPFPLWQASSAEQLQLNQEYVCIEVRLLSGADIQLRIECHQQLSSITELVSLQAGVSPDRQKFVISENKRRFKGYSAAARDIAHSWTARKSTRSLVLGMVNYVFLPEAVNREFSGRGLLQWAKGGVGQYLKGGHRAQGTIQLQVETLSGLLLALDLSADSSLRDMQTLVQQETGVLLDRQRITIEERLPPSKLFQLTNQLLLGSFAGLRVASQAAFWAHARLKRQLWDGRSFPIQIRNGSDQVITMDATMDMTLGQVHDVLARSSVPPTHPSSTSHIQEIVFPPHICMPAVNTRRSIFTGFQSNIVS